MPCLIQPFDLCNHATPLLQPDAKGPHNLSSKGVTTMDGFHYLMHEVRPCELETKPGRWWGGCVLG